MSTQKLRIQLGPMGKPPFRSSVGVPFLHPSVDSSQAAKKGLGQQDGRDGFDSMCQSSGLLSDRASGPFPIAVGLGRQVVRANGFPQRPKRSTD